ncbi:TorD/DmsD family molecular chaperone [Desulfopila aestuarii]|uniref:Chaperone TorD involved in molybdoenzyme TorA maturation n=1 Tax=Desulfopila aestuarii DSM 18488 TaxID=1121416 RepID=A0A1M7YHZ9_9BACT|nr:molecular chaperone TorD family protein [Desulfopila aestuarii]SHO52241.1 chaperone TorD involved in molybdoenzyme TorA maturation [Desulfopila aestuarii DSM 18488]
MNTILDHSADEILDRGNCFKLLAACFYEPEKKLFIEEALCDKLHGLLEKCAPGAAGHVKTMQESLLKLEEQQLKIDYSALFVGPFELIAAPYGSIYLENERKVMGESTLAVQRFYENSGLMLDIQEPPDHIAIELEFMSFLCISEAEALTTGDMETAIRQRELQVDFATTMMSWIPLLAENIQAGAQTEYYKALASCLERFYDISLAIYDPGVTPACYEQPNTCS